ncbi:hypothetical protein V2W45_1468421 [Cenococcum geophilum]
MGFHGPISKNAAHSTAWDTVLPSRAFSHHKIPHVLWGDFLWAAAFRIPTSCLHTIYFVVPNDRADAALGLLGSSGPADFLDIPVLKYMQPRIGVIPGDPVAFDPTDMARTTTIECDHSSIPVPTLPGLLDLCADIFPNLAECYTLLYCFRKGERGSRWTSIGETAGASLNNFVDSGKYRFPEDSDDDVEDSGWEDDEDEVLDNYG